MKKMICIAIVMVIILVTVFALSVSYSVVKIDECLNEISSSYLESDGCVLVKVTSVNNSFLNIDIMYGYITEEDYQSYLDGKIEGILVVKHPFEEGEQVTIPFREIKSIETDVYL